MNIFSFNSIRSDPYSLLYGRYPVNFYGKNNKWASKKITNLDRGDGPLLGCSDPLLHAPHVGSEGGLVTNSRGNTTQQGGHLRPSLENKSISQKGGLLLPHHRGNTTQQGGHLRPSLENKSISQNGGLLPHHRGNTNQLCRKSQTQSGKQSNGWAGTSVRHSLLLQRVNAAKRKRNLFCFKNKQFFASKQKRRFFA